MKLKSIMVVVLSFFCMNSFAFDPYDDVFSTKLCAHKYESKSKYYYCSDKIDNVFVSFGFDEFYDNKSFNYIGYAKSQYVKKLEEFKERVNKFHYKIVDQDRRPVRIIPKKNEALYHWQFLKPDFINKKLDIVIFVSINGKFDVINSQINITDIEHLESDFKKHYENERYSCFLDLYAANN
jgi:hypothetical protein